MMKFSSCLATARQEFYKAVQDLHKPKDKPDVDGRLQQANELIESYFTVTGEVPQPRVLNRLADYLLVDILSDQYKHHRKDAYPIQSNNQVKRKQYRHGHTTYYDDISDKWRNAK